MVNNLEKSTTVTAQSIINVNGEPVTVAFMSATIPAIGSTSISHMINNKELFNANAEAVQNDFKEFDEHVYSL